MSLNWRTLVLSVVAVPVSAVLLNRPAAAEPPAVVIGEFAVTNPAKDITVLSDRDESIPAFFARNRLIVGSTKLDGKPDDEYGNLGMILTAKAPLSKYFISYVTANYKPLGLYAARVDIAVPAPAMAKMLRELKEAGTGERRFALILRPDDKTPGLHHIVGFMTRNHYALFFMEKSDPADGFGASDLQFKGAEAEPKAK